MDDPGTNVGASTSSSVTEYEQALSVYDNLVQEYESNSHLSDADMVVYEAKLIRAVCHVLNVRPPSRSSVRPRLNEWLRVVGLSAPNIRHIELCGVHDVLTLIQKSEKETKSLAERGRYSPESKRRILRSCEAARNYLEVIKGKREGTTFTDKQLSWSVKLSPSLKKTAYRGTSAESASPLSPRFVVTSVDQRTTGRDSPGSGDLLIPSGSGSFPGSPAPSSVGHSRSASGSGSLSVLSGRATLSPSSPQSGSTHSTPILGTNSRVVHSISMQFDHLDGAQRSPKLSRLNHTIPHKWHRSNKFRLISDQMCTVCQRPLGFGFLNAWEKCRSCKWKVHTQCKGRIGDTCGLTPDHLRQIVEVKSEHLKMMKLPFRFHYANGKISNIVFHSDDDTFSENAKRAILNTLQVQLENPQDREERLEDSYSFSLNETTIEGDCESLYIIRKTKAESDEVDSFNVTKSIDFSRCQYRPELRYNYFRYAEPREWSRENSNNMDEKMNQKLIHSNPALDISTVHESVINGDRRQFIIKESRVLSRYSYEIVDAYRVQMTTYAITKMTLQGVEQVSEERDSMPSSKSAQTLVYSDKLDILKEQFIAEGDETYLRQNPYLKMTNAPGIVANIMKRLLDVSTKDTVEGIDELATRYLTQLVSTLRLCTRSDIEEIHRKLFENDEYDGIQKTFMQGILADSLAIAGTKNTIDHLLKKIRNGDISSTKAIAAISKLMNVRLISYETVRNLERLCQDSRMEDSNMLKRTCMLTYGALVNAMCKVDSPLKHSDKYTTSVSGKYCDATTKKDIAQAAISHYNKASNRGDKILALKTIGNMGLETTVSFLEQIIRDWNVEKLIRIQAIDALRQMRKEMPRRIQRILLPVFQDRREHPEIRMNALYQLLQSTPDQGILDMIMVEMIREPNSHVKSFVNQIVYQMAESSEDFYDRETAKTLRSMLKHFKLYSSDEKTPMFTSKFYSSVVAVDHSQLHELASQFNFATLFGNDSRIPKEIMATVNLLSNNRIIPNTYQVGLHTQDVEQLIERLSTTFGKDLDEIVFRGRRSITQEAGDFLKSLYNKMKIATRRTSSDRASPMLLLYTRYQDMDTFFCLTDEDSLPELLKNFIVDERLDVSHLEHKNLKFNWVFASYGFEYQIKTPTVTGLPLLTTLRMPTIAVVDGTVSTSFNEIEEENHFRSARVHLKVEPKVATTVMLKMEVFSPLFTSGVKTFHSAQIRFPLNMIAKVRAPHWAPEFEFVMPTQEVRMLHLQSRPVTFFRTWPAKSGVFVEATEKTLIVEEGKTPLKQRRIEFVDPFIGMNINIDSHWHANSPQGLQKLLGDWILSGENSLEIKIQPIASSNKVVKVSFKPNYKKSNDLQRIEMPDLKELFGEQTKEMLAHVTEDELKLIREEMALAKGKLNNFFELLIKAEALKGSRHRTAKIDLKTLCDDRMLLCIANKKVDIDSEWTWKTVAHIAMPELRGVVAGFPSKHLIARVDTTFGSSEKSEMKWNIYGRPSVKRIEAVRRYSNLQAEKSFESEDDEAFTDAPSVLKPNDFVMTIENKLSPRINRRLRSFRNFLVITDLVNIPQPELLEEELNKKTPIIMSRLILDDQYTNLTVTVPNQGQYSMNWDDSETESRAPGLFDVIRQSQDENAECSIKKGKFIRSFDGKTFRLPMTTCYTVIAKDCTESPEFVLMAKKVQKDREDLKMKMVTKSKTYELYQQNGKMVVKVNNYQIEERNFEEYGIYKVANRESLYEIRCRDTGASARFDGVNILVRIGSNYVNRQCGICGHMNYDASDDFRRADNEEAESLRDFHNSYLYKDDECDVDAVQSVNRDSSEEGQEDREYRHDATEDEVDQENSDPIKKTITVESHGKICFSQQPVEQCPSESRRIRSEMKKVPFQCMSRNQHHTRRLLRALRSQNTVELPDAEETENFEINVPSRCSSKFDDVEDKQ